MQNKAIRNQPFFSEPTKAGKLCLGFAPVRPLGTRIARRKRRRRERERSMIQRTLKPYCQTYRTFGLEVRLRDTFGCRIAYRRRKRRERERERERECHRHFGSSLLPPPLWGFWVTAPWGTGWLPGHLIGGRSSQRGGLGQHTVAISDQAGKARRALRQQTTLWRERKGD